MALTVKTKDWKAGRRWARRNALAPPGVTYTLLQDGRLLSYRYEDGVAGGRVRIVPFNGGEKARRSDRYVNAIAEAWLELGQAFRDGMIDIDDNPSVIAQLSARRYTVQGDRRIKLESKDDFKKRSTGGSPDDADALAMCWAATGPGVGVW